MLKKSRESFESEQSEIVVLESAMNERVFQVTVKDKQPADSPRRQFRRDGFQPIKVTEFNFKP